MTRPTKDELGIALAWVKRECPSDWEAADSVHQLLAAEVLALREELAAQTELVTLHKLDAARTRAELGAMQDIAAMGSVKLKMTATYDTEAVDALMLCLNVRMAMLHTWVTGVVAIEKKELQPLVQAVSASRVPPPAPLKT